MKSPYIDRITKEPWEAVLFPPDNSASPEELVAASSAMLFCVQQANDTLSMLTDFDATQEFLVNWNMAQDALRELGPRLSRLQDSELNPSDRETLASVRNWLHEDRVERIDAIAAEALPVSEYYAGDYEAGRDMEIDGPDRDGPDFG